jgi:hypothetical protein
MAAEVLATDRQHQARAQQRMRDLQPESILRPETLSSPAGRQSGRESLKALAKLMDEAEAASRGRDARISAWKAENLAALSQSERASFEGGFERSHRARTALETAWVALQREYVGLAGQVIDVVESAPGRTEASGGMLMFSDEPSLSKYNELIERIGRLDAKQRELSRVPAN